MNSIDAVLKISQDDRNMVLKLIGTSREDIERDVEILKEWMTKEFHLPQGVKNDQFFENMLLRNKCRVEKAKACIESYFTLKTLWPEVFTGIKDIMPSTCNIRIIPLPNLTKDKERVILSSLKSDDPTDYNMKDFIDMGIAIAELTLKHDYSNGVRFIVDFTPCTISFVRKLMPNLLLKFISAIQGGYAMRIVGLEFYKTGNWITPFLAIIKPILPAKIFSRIRVHNDLNSLMDVIPKEILPKDYGGTEKSVDELLEDWDQVFNENAKVFEDALKQVSNEALRTNKYKFDEHIFGTVGTFKKLTID